MQRHYISALVLLLLSATIAHAQVPRAISYQGVLADDAGTLVQDGDYTIRISLHDALTGGNEIFAETHEAIVVRGVFNLRIGSTTPLPASLRFDRAYFLEITVEGTTLGPRTPLTATPYAMRAATAELSDGLTPNATGAVRALNGASGDLTLTGAGGTTITRSGETITIMSTGTGGTGIQGVQNSDGSLAITTPAGPVAGLSVAPGGITTAKLAELAVTTEKIDDNAVNSSKILDGSIGGDDISNAAELNVASLATTGNASVGTQASSARLTVQGAGTTSTGAGLNVTNSAATSLMYVRNDGNVGIGTTTPVTSLEVAGTGGLYISGGNLFLSKTSVPGAQEIAIPSNKTIVEVTDDGISGPNRIILPNGVEGQVLFLIVTDANGAQSTGYERDRLYMHVYISGRWRIIY